MTPDDTRTLIRQADAFNQTHIGTHTSIHGVAEHVGIPDDARRMHTLNVGPTGHGKSQLLVHTALQDAYKDHGLAIINPKGKLIDEFLAKLPDDRADDVVYINPSYARVPAFNVLDPPTTRQMSDAAVTNQQELIVANITAVFRRLSDGWGDRLGRNLQTLLRAHLRLNTQSGREYTLEDVYHALVDDDQLETILDQVHHPVIYQQLLQIQHLTDKETEPLERRFADFLTNDTVRRCITGTTTPLDFRQIVNDGRILLVDLQKGELGTNTVTVLGGLLLTKIWAAAQSRIAQPAADRAPYYLFVDELDTFSGEGSNFATMLSEAREYRLNCWLACQYLRQLPSDLRDAVVNNCRTKIFFSPDSTERLPKIARLFHGLEKDDLLRLGKYRAAVQLPGDHGRQDAILVDTYPPWETDWDRAHTVKEWALAQYTAADEPSIASRKGRGMNTGGAQHSRLLEAAYDHFTADGWQVHILHQATDSEKPDAHLIDPDTDEIVHVEAECGTVEKPGKVLRNVQRAAADERELVFVTEPAKAPQLQNILLDPVNRYGDEYEDAAGAYAYYTVDGEPVEDTDCVEAVNWRIFVRTANGLVAFDDDPAIACPELGGDLTETELASQCLYRTAENHCEKLDSECIVRETQ